MIQQSQNECATIDEALEKTHFGKFNIYIILISAAILNNVVLESVGISFALPIIVCDLNLSHKQQGVLGAVCFLGIIVSSHCWGLLADTKGRKWTMRPALILGFATTLLSSFSTNFTMMAVFRFLNGICISAGSATIFAYMGEYHCPKHRNRAILYAAFMSAFGALLYPGIAWGFINQSWELEITFLGIIYKPWRLYLVMCGLSGLFCGILFTFLPESPKYLLSVGRSAEALQVLQEMHDTNTKANKKLQNDKFEITTLLPDLDTPMREFDKNSGRKSILTLLKVIWNQTAPLFMRQYIRKTLLSCIILYISFFTAHGVYLWFPYLVNNIILYTNQHEEPKSICDIVRITQSSNFSTIEQNEDKICVTKLEISTYKHTLAFEVIYVTLLFLVIYANKRFQRIPILFTILTLTGLCGILSVAIKLPLLAIYLFILFLSCGVGIVVLNTVLVDMYPTNLRAMAVCISLMFGRIGSVSGSNILGALIETHCEEALYSSAIALIIAGFLGFLLPKTEINKKDQQMVENGN